MQRESDSYAKQARQWCVPRALSLRRTAIQSIAQDNQSQPSCSKIGAAGALARTYRRGDAGSTCVGPANLARARNLRNALVSLMLSCSIRVPSQDLRELDICQEITPDPPSQVLDQACSLGDAARILAGTICHRLHAQLGSRQR